MNQQDTQERLSNEIAQLVETLSRLVEALGASPETTQPNCPQCGRPFSDDDMSPQAFSDDVSSQVAEESAHAALSVSQEVRLGYEIDQCSGVLSIRNKDNRWIYVPRGRWTTIDVAIDGNGYWHWRCGSSSERSRGSSNFRQRVKRLKVWHSTESRKITWWCYDLL